MLLEVAPAKRGTETAAAIVPATPATMDPEFAMAAEVAPEEGTVVPAAIIEDVAVEDRQVVIVVGAAIIRIAIAVAAIGVAIIIGVISRLAIARTAIRIVGIIAVW